MRADETITASIPIESHGEPVGLQHGGQLEQALHELEVNCKPADMPEVIEVEVSEMELDDVLHVSDLALPEGVEAALDPELPVFQVRIPRITVPEEEEEVEEALVGEGLEEPELIDEKGKREEEEETEPEEA